jgi:hypothetical protein
MLSFNDRRPELPRAFTTCLRSMEAYSRRVYTREPGRRRRQWRDGITLRAPLDREVNVPPRSNPVRSHVHSLIDGDLVQNLLEPHPDIVSVVGIGSRLRRAVEDHFRLTSQETSPFGRGGLLHDGGQSVHHADDDGGHGPRRLLNLVECSVANWSIGGIGFNPTDALKAIPVNTFLEGSAGDLAQTGGNSIDTGTGGEGIVHRRGQSTNGDLNELIDGEHGVLHECPVGTRQGLIRGRPRPQMESR